MHRLISKMQYSQIGFVKDTQDIIAVADGILHLAVLAKVDATDYNSFSFSGTYGIYADNFDNLRRIFGKTVFNLALPVVRKESAFARDTDCEVIGLSFKAWDESEKTIYYTTWLQNKIETLTN